jgi:putative oxidoreductase
MTNVPTTEETARASVRSAPPVTLLRLGLALVFLGAGAGKLLGVPPMVALFHTAGFSDWFRYAVGLFELLCAVLLTIPATSRPAALGLCTLMVGAAGTEVLVLHRPPILSLITLAALAFIARRRPSSRTMSLIGALAGAVLGAIMGLFTAQTSRAQPPAQPPAQDTTPAAPSATALPPEGVYTYTLAPDSSDDIKQAVNRTVDPMSFITRPIARGRLNATNPTPQAVHVNVGGDTLGVAFDDGNPVVTPLDGTTVPWQSSLTHETYSVHSTTAGDTVSQFIAAPDGTRENSYVFLDHGQRLKLRVTVRSHRLPGPLVYDLLFRRTPA